MSRRLSFAGRANRGQELAAVFTRRAERQCTAPRRRLDLDCARQWASKQEAESREVWGRWGCASSNEYQVLVSLVAGERRSSAALKLARGAR